MSEANAARDVGVFWLPSKPKLICRNYSTGNVRALERDESLSTTNRSDKFPRIRSLSSLVSKSSCQLGERPISESFFKGLAEKYDRKNAQESRDNSRN